MATESNSSITSDELRDKASNVNQDETHVSNIEPFFGHQEPELINTRNELGNFTTAKETDAELSRIETDVALSRIASRRTLDYDELIKTASQMSKPLPPMGNGRPYPKHPGSREPYCVQYDGGIKDPDHPFNFPFWKKFVYTASVGMSAFSCSVGSAMFAQASQDLMSIYKIGFTVATLSTSLYVFGFATGPVIYGPLSELFGRKMVMIPSCLCYVAFSFATAVSKDLQSIMLCRFFAGFTGSASLVVAPASMSDMFDNKHRGTAISIFAMVLFGGPMIAPIMGGFTVKNSTLGWRWTAYFCGLIGVLAFVMNCFLLEETHHPIVLKNRAEELRRRTRNWGIYAPHEELTLSIKEIAEKNLVRPVKLLFTEPILFLISIYNSFIYGMLYLFLTAVPLIFGGVYGWSSGVAELPYVSMLLGVFCGGLMIIYFEKRYNSTMDANNGVPVPEERLLPMMVGGFTFPIGIFWLGWFGAYGQHIHWILPVIGCFITGHGLMMIFLPSFNYIIDCYLLHAASALAGNTLIRSGFGGAFPLFARQMFVNLEIQWASTLLGCLAVLLLPIPFLFYKFGKRLRQKSTYAFDL
ncbi:unnamed protein product [Candida verbasci]|uniref:Major facilitator superfamily (MFS) profile domain-containing protein n=1 Tax=Candida verbasci TaxID=1227364 RepID=A0A9W4XNF1_9ASCO|nr:unnamed protein product [Candida verbasci]